MLVAGNRDNDKNLAWLTEKSQGPFFCPECKEDVILRKGKVRAHHFAHKPPVSCAYGTGESQKHLMVKRQIYEALIDYPGCSKCELERYLKGVRPDVSLFIGLTPVAIEVQKSAINIDEILRRTKQYTKLGICILWVLPDRYPETFFHDTENVHRIKEWEKYIHALYFGRIYYWQAGALVIPYHFGEYGTWKDDYQDGDFTGGSYWYIFKTLKTISKNKGIHIADDFRSTIRNEWNSKNWSLPKSKLWIDISERWW